MKRRFLPDRCGGTAVEYAVLASLLAVTVLLMMPVGDSLVAIFQELAAGFGD